MVIGRFVEIMVHGEILTLLQIEQVLMNQFTHAQNLPILRD